MSYKSKNYKVTFIEKSTKIHQERYDYTSLPDFFTYKDVVPIKCKIHGLFSQKARIHVMGSGCQLCAREVRLQHYAKITHTLDQFIQKSQQVHGTVYDYSATIYKTQMERVEIICPQHGKFSIIANNHLYGTGCSKCKRSRGETLIQQWLDKQQVVYETQKSFPSLIMPDCKKLTNRPKYDFFIPSHNLLIEFDGKHHFEPVTFRGVSKEEALRLHQRTVFADSIKTSFARQQGINLLRIPFTKLSQIAQILEQHF